jgi:hypothetical protein
MSRTEPTRNPLEYATLPRQSDWLTTIALWTVLTAVAVGAIGFLIGFVGPMIFYPSSNIGPIIGFLTGPLGFVLGAIIGCVVGVVRKPRSR